jgi:hypothetical protein
MSCPRCGVLELFCRVEDRHEQLCPQCGEKLSLVFTPTTNMFIPNAFRYTFSELFGMSEKEFVKSNPDIERINPSTFKSIQERRKERRAQLEREVKELEHVVNANRTLRGGESGPPIRIDYKIGTGDAEP